MIPDPEQLEQPPDPTGATTDPGPLRQFLVIFRRRWRLLSIVWVGTLIGVAVYTWNLPKLYRPQATLEIRPETSLVSSDPQDSSLMASRNLWENY
jgi:uncharacterized protein involved in exopolysaccharide biosynthesis